MFQYFYEKELEPFLQGCTERGTLTSAEYTLYHAMLTKCQAELKLCRENPVYHTLNFQLRPENEYANIQPWCDALTKNMSLHLLKMHSNVHPFLEIRAVTAIALNQPRNVKFIRNAELYATLESAPTFVAFVRAYAAADGFESIFAKYFAERYSMTYVYEMWIWKMIQRHDEDAYFKTKTTTEIQEILAFVCRHLIGYVMRPPTASITMKQLLGIYIILKINDLTETRAHRFLQNLNADVNVKTLQDFAHQAPEEYRLFRQYFGTTHIEYEHPAWVNVEKILTKLVQYRTYLMSHPDFHQTWLREFDPKLSIVKTSKQNKQNSLKKSGAIDHDIKPHPLFSWMYSDPTKWSKYSVELRAFAIHLSEAESAPISQDFFSKYPAASSSSSKPIASKAFGFFNILHPVEPRLVADFGKDSEGINMLQSTLYTKEYVLTAPLQMASNRSNFGNQALYQRLDHDLLDIISLISHKDATALETHLMYLEQNAHDPFYNPFVSNPKTIRWPSLNKNSRLTFDRLKTPKHIPDTPEEGIGGDTYDSMIQNMLQHTIQDLCRMLTPYKVTLKEHARTVGVVFYMMFRFGVKIPQSSFEQLYKFVYSLVHCDDEKSFLTFYVNLKNRNHASTSMEQLHTDVPWLIYCHLRFENGLEIDADRLYVILKKYHVSRSVILEHGGTQVMLVHLSRRLLLLPDDNLVTALRPTVQRYFYEKLSHQYRESECDITYYSANDVQSLPTTNALLPSAVIRHKATQERIVTVYDCSYYMDHKANSILDNFIMTDNPYELPSSHDVAASSRGRQSVRLLGHSMSAQYKYSVQIEDDCVHRYLYGDKFTLCHMPLHTAQGNLLSQSNILSQSNNLLVGHNTNTWVCISRLSKSTSSTQPASSSSHTNANTFNNNKGSRIPIVVVAVIEFTDSGWECALGSDGRLYDSTLTYVVVTDAPNVLMRWVHLIPKCALLQSVRAPEEHRILIIVPHQLQPWQTSAQSINNVAFLGGPSAISFEEDAGVKFLVLSRNGLHCSSDSGIRTLAAYMLLLWAYGRFELIHTLIHQLIHGLGDSPIDTWPAWLTYFVGILETGALGCPYRLFYKPTFSLVEQNERINPYTQNLQGRQSHYPLCYRPLDAVKDAQSSLNAAWIYTHAFIFVSDFVNDPLLRALMTATNVISNSQLPALASSPSSSSAASSSVVHRSNHNTSSKPVVQIGYDDDVHMDTGSQHSTTDEVHSSGLAEATAMNAYRLAVQTCNLEDTRAFDSIVLGSTGPLTLHIKRIAEARKDAIQQLSDALTMQSFELDYTHTRFVMKNAKFLYTLLECDTLMSVIQKVEALLSKSRQAHTSVNCQELQDCMKILASSEYGIYMGPRTLTIVVFETCFENLILNSQHTLFHKIRASLMQPNDAWMSTYQLLMGKGKTSVLTPLLVLDMQFRRNTNADGKAIAQDVFLVLPEHLVQQSLKMFRSRYSNVMPHMSVLYLNVDRSFSMDLNFKQFFQHLGGQHGKFFIVSDGTIKSIHLNLVEEHKRYADSEKGPRIYFANECVYLFDEVDTLMNPITSELNYPINGQTRIHDQDMLEDAVLGILTFMHEKNLLHTVHETVESATSFLLDTLEKFLDQLGASRDWTYYIPLHHYVTLWAYSLDTSHEITNPHMYHHYYFDSSRLFPNEVYCMHRMVRTIAFALTWIYNKDYGFGSDNPAYAQKNSLVAIPYQAVNHPADGSEFSELTLNLVLTTLSYLHQRIDTVRKQDMRVLQQMLEKEYDGLSGNWPLFIQSKYVRGILGYYNVRPNDASVLRRSGDVGNANDADQLTVDKLEQVDFHEMAKYVALNRQARQCFVHIYVKNYIFKHFAQINCGQFNTSFLDIASTCFSRQRVGFSGTVHIPEPQFVPSGNSYAAVKLSKSQIIEDVMSNGGMQCAMRGIYNPQMKVLFKHKGANTAVLANKACHWNSSAICMCGLQTSADVRLICHAVSAGYDALIDAGAFLRNLSAYEVARLIHLFLKETHQQKKHVIYVDEHDRLYRFDDDSTDTSSVHISKAGVATGILIHPYNNEFVNEPLFLYYDHRHIVGIDIKQPFAMYGLTTVNYFNTYTEVAQAVFRLRNMNSGHRVDFLLFDNFISTYNLLSHAYNAMRSAQIKDSMETSEHTDSLSPLHQSITAHPVHQIENVSPHTQKMVVGVNEVVMFLQMKEEENYDQMKTQLTIQTLKMLARYHPLHVAIDVQTYQDVQFNERVTEMLSFSRDNKALTSYTDWIRSRLCKPHPYFQSEISAMCKELHQKSVKTLINGRATNKIQNQVQVRIRNENQSQHQVQSIEATNTISLATTLQMETHLTVRDYVNFYHTIGNTNHYRFMGVLVNTDNGMSPDPSAAPHSPIALTTVQRLRKTLQEYEIFVTTLFLQKLVDSLRFADLSVWRSQGLFYLREEDSYLLLSQYEMSALVLHQRTECKNRDTNPSPIDEKIDVSDALQITSGYDRYGSNWNTLDHPVHSKRAVDVHEKSVVIQLLLGKQMDAYERMRLIFYSSASEETFESCFNVVTAFEEAMERSYITAETLDTPIYTFLKQQRTNAWLIFTRWLSSTSMFASKSSVIQHICGLKASASEDLHIKLREQLLGYQARIEGICSKSITVMYAATASPRIRNDDIMSDENSSSLGKSVKPTTKRQRSSNGSPVDDEESTQPSTIPHKTADATHARAHASAAVANAASESIHASAVNRSVNDASSPSSNAKLRIGNAKKRTKKSADSESAPRRSTRTSSTSSSQW